jgi:RNA polymerase sigma-70 factor (sigma-E family)
MTSDRPTFDERLPVLAALAYRVCFRIVGDRQDAQDLTQEALARAYARWPRISTFDEAWITRVATNLALGEVRRRGRAERGRVAPTGDPAIDAVVAQRAELVDVLRRLSRRQREVVALRYLADLPEAEVARALGCSVGTVKQHASRGLAALRVALASDPSIGPSAGPSIGPSAGPTVAAPEGAS